MRDFVVSVGIFYMALRNPLCPPQGGVGGVAGVLLIRHPPEVSMTLYKNLIADFGSRPQAYYIYFIVCAAMLSGGCRPLRIDDGATLIAGRPIHYKTQ